MQPRAQSERPWSRTRGGSAPQRGVRPAVASRAGAWAGRGRSAPSLALLPVHVMIEASPRGRSTGSSISPGARSRGRFETTGVAIQMRRPSPRGFEPSPRGIEAPRPINGRGAGELVNVNFARLTQRGRYPTMIALQKYRFTRRNRWWVKPPLFRRGYRCVSQKEGGFGGFEGRCSRWKCSRIEPNSGS